MFNITQFVHAAEVAQQIPVKQTSHIDFSQLDTLVGILVGGTVVAVIVGFILWGAIKAGVLSFGKPEPPPALVPGLPPGVCSLSNLCREHGEEKERSLTNQRGIDALWRKFDEQAKRLDSFMSRTALVQTQLILGMIKAGHLPESTLQVIQDKLE